MHNVCDYTKTATVKEFDIVDYADKYARFENHHGVLDKWATENIPGYKSRANDSPSIALTAGKTGQHAATKRVYREWLYEKTGKKVGGKIDWKTISAREMQSLSEKMFDAAHVPESARRAYYQSFHRYIYK